MKDLLFFLIVIIFFSSCATINELGNEAIHHAIVGQNMKVVRDRLGLPTKIISAPDGEKRMLYEYQNMDLVHYSDQFNTNVPYAGYKPRKNSFYFNPYAKANNMIYENYYRVPENKWLFKVFINKQGYCYKVYMNLSPEQLEQYYERFKHYIPNKK